MKTEMKTTPRLNGRARKSLAKKMKIIKPVTPGETINFGKALFETFANATAEERVGIITPAEARELVSVLRAIGREEIPVPGEKNLDENGKPIVEGDFVISDGPVIARVVHLYEGIATLSDRYSLWPCEPAVDMAVYAQECDQLTLIHSPGEMYLDIERKALAARGVAMYGLMPPDTGDGVMAIVTRLPPIQENATRPAEPPENDDGNAVDGLWSYVEHIEALATKAYPPNHDTLRRLTPLYDSTLTTPPSRRELQMCRAAFLCLPLEERRRIFNGWDFPRELLNLNEHLATLASQSVEHGVKICPSSRDRSVLATSTNLYGGSTEPVQSLTIRYGTTKTQVLDALDDIRAFVLLHFEKLIVHPVIAGTDSADSEGVADFSQAASSVEKPK